MKGGWIAMRFKWCSTHAVLAALLLVAGAPLLFPGPASAAAPKLWVRQGRQPQGNHLSAAAEGAGTKVLVGEGGTVLTSPDGTFWTARVSGTAENLAGVAFGDGVFAIVGSQGTVLTSADAATWVVRENLVKNDLSAVTFGSNLFVAVGTRRRAFL
jgi:photosystem II stability/assembly factor-like uncharacterized protein